MSKQDRQGVRTAADIERKYNFGKSFAEVMEIAIDAQDAAEKANEGVDGLDKKLDHDEIFNRLTKDSTLEGLYRGEDGELYINATYIKSGEILADLIKSGVIKSRNGESILKIDLDIGLAILHQLQSYAEMYSVVNGQRTHVSSLRTWLSGGTVSIKETSADTGEEIGHADIDSGGLSVRSPSGLSEFKATNAFMKNSEDGTRLDIKLQSGRAKISGLTAPVDASDAVNKEYVDKTAICYGEYAISSLNETDAVMTAIVNSIGGYGKRFIMFNYNGQLFGCTVYRGSERYSWAEADSYTSDNAYKMHRVMLAGVWQPWEWENPPMKPGVEYRTTERWNGKPVYAWLIDAGALPNATTKTLYFSNSSSTVGEVISCEGSTSGGMSLPHIVASTAASVYLDNGRGYVNIITGVDRSASTAKIMVKYTKTTD